MNALLIQGGRIVDPSQNVDRTGDLLIADGKIVGIDQPAPAGAQTLDARGLIVSPGWIDAQVALREPGFEIDETAYSGTKAAVAGGMTSIASLPDTQPVVDNRASIEFIQRQAERAGHCHVFPLGAVTKKHEGEELADIGQLVDGGAVGFTDAKHPVANAEVMRRALQYTSMFRRPILHHPKVPELTQKGVMHEGFTSTELGLAGMPAAAEEIMVSRDVALAELTGGHVHLMCVSTANSVERIRRSKQRGIKVTAGVAIHQLVATDEAMNTFNPLFKVDPPLRTQEDIDALIEGLKDGTIDLICSDHQPISEEKKNVEVDLAPFGIVGLETLLPLAVTHLVAKGLFDWPELIGKLTVGPASVLGLPKGTLAPGADADVTILDPEARWTIDARKFHSVSHNTPFDGWEVQGKTHTVIVSGQIRFPFRD